MHALDPSGSNEIRPLGECEPIGCDVWPKMSEYWAVDHLHPSDAIEISHFCNPLASGNVT